MMKKDLCNAFEIGQKVTIVGMKKPEEMVVVGMEKQGIRSFINSALANIFPQVAVDSHELTKQGARPGETLYRVAYGTDHKREGLRADSRAFPANVLKTSVE